MNGLQNKEKTERNSEMDFEMTEPVTEAENAAPETACAGTPNGGEKPSVESGGGASESVDQNGAEALREELNRTRERVTQLERERSLLLQGVPEEDLDYYVYKIGKLVTEEKDFDSAVKEFLKQQGTVRRAVSPRSTGASLTGRTAKPQSTSDTMNKLLRGA